MAEEQAKRRYSDREIGEMLDQIAGDSPITLFGPPGTPRQFGAWIVRRKDVHMHIYGMAMDFGFLKQSPI